MMSDEKFDDEVEAILAEEKGKEEKRKTPSKKSSRSSSRRTTSVSSVHANGKDILRIPYVYRVKSLLQKMLYVPILMTLYMMYVTYDAGKLGINTTWACAFAIACTIVCIVIIKYTNSEDYWEEYSGRGRNED